MITKYNLFLDDVRVPTDVTWADVPIDQHYSVVRNYKELLPSKVQIEPSASPIGDILRYAKNHPDEKVYFILGYREGREDAHP